MSCNKKKEGISQGSKHKNKERINNYEVDNKRR